MQGRPKGENKEEDKKKFSLKPVVARLSELLGQEVRSQTDTSAPAVLRPPVALSQHLQPHWPPALPDALQVKLVEDCIGPSVESAVKGMKNGQVSTGCSL